MSAKLTSSSTVAYADVDRHELMLLPRLFKLLQDVAIAHANQFGTGTQSATLRGETWVLNRIAARINRYPRADEHLRVETWSSGIKGFKGYREFRVFDAQEQLLVTASSLWLYISVRTKAIVRVPRDLANQFPVGTDDVAFPDLESTEFATPGESAAATPLSLRYSDFDVNEHVNNAAYFDFVQTALAAARLTVHPRLIRMKYAKEIPNDAAEIALRVEAAGGRIRFSIDRNRAMYAVGDAEV